MRAVRRLGRRGGPARRRPGRAWRGVAVAALWVFTLFPVGWMLATAVNPAGGHGFGGGVTLANFRFVLVEGHFGRYLLNSALVAAGTVLVSGLLALLAAVAVSRFRFRFRTAVLVLVLVVQMVPLEALVIPLFIQARHLGLLDSLLGLVVVYVAFSLPFAIWTLRGFVGAIPVDIEEAAYVDGASWTRMFFSILLPLVAPGLVATSVFSFITAWNEFVFALTFLSDDSKYTVAVGLRTFFGLHSTDWGAVMAGSTLITIPVMVFFVLVQRRLTAGLVAGASKG